jgi:RNA polymerase sigma factor (sigma-70 family)
MKTEEAVADSRSDEDLVSTMAIDPDAFEEFYRRHIHKVMGFAVRRCTTPEEVADLASAVFLVVIQAAPRFDPKLGRAVPWLLGIAAKEYARGARRRAREAKALARLAGRELLDDADHLRLEEQIDAARLAPQVRAAIAALPPTERHMVELTGVDGLSPTDAAAALGIRPSTARMRLNRGRKKLRRALERGGADSPGDGDTSAGFMAILPEAS